jgi:hypothetical protein
MAFNFPASANVGDIYNSGSFSFQFDGVAWNYVNTTAVLAYAQANAAYNAANSAARITFGTIIANGNSIIATSNNDTLTIIANANVSIVGNSSTKNVTFDLTDTGVVYSTYGNATIIPVFTVDNKGRLTSVTNTAIDTTIATSAFARANAANLIANLAFDKANTANVFAVAAFARANTANITADAAFARANAANLIANLAYDKANTANVFAVAAFARANAANLIANLAFDKANTANVIAVAAFNAANSPSNAVLKTGNTMTGNLVMSSANITFATAVNSGIYWGGTGLSFIHSPAANTLVFGTSLTERMRIASDGNVGIGTSSPAAKLDIVGSVTDARANVLSQTLTDGASIAWDASLGRIATVTLGGARTLSNATNLRVGTYILHVLQNTSGNSTLTFSNQYKFTANIQPSLTSNANARDMFSFVSDGTNMYGAMIPDVRS